MATHRIQRKSHMSRPSVWAPKIVALIKGGNGSAAIAQIKVAPTVKDLQDLRKLLIAANLLKSQPNVDAATSDMIAELSAPRLHRSP
jgi:hypothetical protein